MSFPMIDGLRVIEFGTEGPLRERLVDLVLSGAKRATAGLVAEYVEEGEPLEHVGERLVVVDNNGAAIGMIAVTAVEVVRFADVPDEFALAEGEGDRTGDDFRASHCGYWAGLGLTVVDDTEVVLLRFELVTT